jgi:hypothetical protein
LSDPKTPQVPAVAPKAKVAAPESAPDAANEHDKQEHPDESGKRFQAAKADYPVTPYRSILGNAMAEAEKDLLLAKVYLAQATAARHESSLDHIGVSEADAMVVVGRARVKAMEGLVHALTPEPPI